MIYALPLPLMVLWMIGGQFLKGARRFGIPGLALMVTLWRAIRIQGNKKEAWKLAVFLLFIPVLATGYGINSALGKYLKKEWIIRLAYAILLSIPFGIYILLSSIPLFKYAIITLALIGAFQVRAGSLGHIGKYDILIEDMVRSLTFGYSLVWIVT